MTEADKQRDISPESSPARDGMAPPQTFFLELTNHCNLRCSMCNFHSPLVARIREKGFMETPLALRLLDEIAELSPARPWIALHGAGEPLLHKDLPRILRHGSSLGLDIGFLTNAVLLDDSITGEILDAGISWIGFSIDGIDRAKFEKFRCGAEYDRVVRNTQHFLQEARNSGVPVRTMVNMTLQEEMKGDVTAFVKFWIEQVDQVCVSPFRPVGSRDNALTAELPVIARVPCYMLRQMMLIYWNGKVGLCCEDWFNDGQTGDATISSLKEVWNGDRFAGYRALHESGAYGRVPLCGDCNSWYNALPLSHYDEQLRCTVKKTAWQYSYSRGRDLS